MRLHCGEHTGPGDPEPFGGVSDKEEGGAVRGGPNTS